MGVLFAWLQRSGRKLHVREGRQVLERASVACTSTAGPTQCELMGLVLRLHLRLSLLLQPVLLLPHLAHCTYQPIHAASCTLGAAAHSTPNWRAAAGAAGTRCAACGSRVGVPRCARRESPSKEQGAGGKGLPRGQRPPRSRCARAPAQQAIPPEAPARDPPRRMPPSIVVQEVLTAAGHVGQGRARQGWVGGWEGKQARAGRAPARRGEG